MQFPANSTIAVSDGEKLRLFRNTGNEQQLKLQELPAVSLKGHSKDAGKHHQNSASNPDDRQLAEDGYAAATVSYLNSQVLSGGITGIYVVAPPRTLGQLRQHYHAKLKDMLIGELGKEHTNDSVETLQAALLKA